MSTFNVTCDKGRQTIKRLKYEYHRVVWFWQKEVMWVEKLSANVRTKV